MRVIGPQQLDHTRVIERHRGPQPSRGGVVEVESAFNNFSRLARANWIFAVTEISKGLAIVTIGDMVIAEDFGEVVRIAATALPEMRGAARGRAVD